MNDFVVNCKAIQMIDETITFWHTLHSQHNAVNSKERGGGYLWDSNPKSNLSIRILLGARGGVLLELKSKTLPISHLFDPYITLVISIKGRT